jgi:hypothetical protein
MALSRLERLRKMTAADLEKLPDLLPGPLPAPDTELALPIASLALTAKVVAPAAALAERPNLIASLSDWESESEWEGDCHIEMTLISEAERTLSQTYNKDGHRSKSDGSSSDFSEEEVYAEPAAGNNGLQWGQLSPVGQSFCPVLPVSKFPYKCIPKKDSESVADKFFKAGQFWARELDL